MTLMPTHFNRGAFAQPFCALAALSAMTLAFILAPTVAAVAQDDSDVIVIPSRKRSLAQSETESKEKSSSQSTGKSNRVAKKFPGSKFNLHVLATEAFVNRMIARANSESGEVIDYVMGANINGWQSTDTTLTVDFQPNKKYGQIDFNVRGKTQSETIGDTGIAQISTLGHHSFIATKPAYFDGKQFLTRRATAKVNASNTNQGVVTAFSGLPLIGELADRRAHRKVAEAKYESESIAAQRVSARVNPRLDQEVDKTLSKINKTITDLTAKWLTPQDLEPDAIYSTTSNDFFRYSASIKGETLPVDRPVPTNRPHGKSLSIYIHESLFEQLANRMKLNGREVPMHELEAALGRLKGDTSESGDSTAQPVAAISYSLLFDKQRPAFVSVEDDKMKLNLRFALKPILPKAVLENQDDADRKELMADAGAFAMQSVSIPLSMVTADKTFAINPGPVTVMTAKQPTSANEGEVSEPVTDFTSKLIQMALQQKLQSMELPGKFELPLESGRKLSLTVSKAVAENGWLMLAID